MANLFKNGIGRPSNKIIKVRKLMYIFIGILTFGMIFVGCYILLRALFGN